jgi:hypothetical protein
MLWLDFLGRRSKSMMLMMMVATAVLGEARNGGEENRPGS